MNELAAAIEDPDVLAHVDEACTEKRIELPTPDQDGHDPLISNVRTMRAAEPADYVAAIHANIEKFDGLDESAVTEAAVAAVLPQEEAA